MSAGDYIKAARLRAGLSQRALADILGITQPAISALESGREDATLSRVEQILAALNERLIPIPSRATTAAEAALQVAERSAEKHGPLWGSNRLRPIIELADDLRQASPIEAVLMISIPPALTGEEGVDALIAGVCDMYVAERNLPCPSWIQDPERFSTEPWDVEPLPSLQHQARLNTPRAIARHNVFVEASFFASV